MDNLRKIAGMGQDAPNINTPKSSRGKRLSEEKKALPEGEEGRKELNRVRKRLSVVSSNTLVDGVEDLNLAEEKVRSRRCYAPYYWVLCPPMSSFPSHLFCPLARACRRMSSKAVLSSSFPLLPAFPRRVTAPTTPTSETKMPLSWKRMPRPSLSSWQSSTVMASLAMLVCPLFSFDTTHIFSHTSLHHVP